MDTGKFSRIRVDQDKLFDCYCEVSPNRLPSSTKPYIKRRFPDTYRVKEVLESVPKFTFPTGAHQVEAVTYFSFILTNIDSKWTFGYCRIKPDSDICLVILSHLPLHDTFYKILNHIAMINFNPIYGQGDSNELLSFLKALRVSKITEEQASSNILISYQNGLQCTKSVSFSVPDLESLPCIPNDVNLTQYFNAVSPENMLKIFASVLNERHIIVTSKKLDRLSACVQAINQLIYPMNWQHIFIPVLPNDLLAYLQAPMPFIIGVPDRTFKSLNQEDVNEAVILDADNDNVKTVFDDVRNFPPSVTNSIRADLRGLVYFGDQISRAFLKPIVILIGGYREALEFNEGEKITFNHDRFIQTRPPVYQPFLRKMLELQMFRQFIEGRLDMLNSGRGFNDDFEFEVNMYEERTANRVNLQYQDWLAAMKRKSGVFIKSINPSLKLVCKGIKAKSQQAYKDWRFKLENASSSHIAKKFLYSRMD